MATAVAPRADNRVKEFLYVWEGTDRNNKPMRGETRGPSETVVSTNLRRQGIRVIKIKQQKFRGGRKITDKDIAFFTRQLATMLKAGVPMLQSIDIVGRGHSNARFSRLMMDIKNKIETGVVQSFTGTLENGVSKGRWTILSGTSTGDLQGISGEGYFDATEQESTYTLEVSF